MIRHDSLPEPFGEFFMLSLTHKKRGKVPMYKKVPVTFHDEA